MEDKISVIRAYLEKSFAGCDIEHHEDFDRGSQAFKIHVEEGSLLLKVSDEFIEDNSIDEIEKVFEQAGVVAMLTENVEAGVLLSQNGAELFDRN